MPSIYNVGEDEGDEDAYNRHHLKRELAAAAVGYGERTLKVGKRRIVSRVVKAGAKQKRQNGKNSAYAGWPDATDVGLAHYSADDAVKHEHHSYDQNQADIPKGDEIIKIFHRNDGDDSGGRVVGKTVFQQQMDEERHK